MTLTFHTDPFQQHRFDEVYAGRWSQLQVTVENVSDTTVDLDRISPFPLCGPKLGSLRDGRDSVPNEARLVMSG